MIFFSEEQAAGNFRKKNLYNKYNKNASNRNLLHQEVFGPFEARRQVCVRERYQKKQRQKNKTNQTG
jgi:hypothetical protein